MELFPLRLAETTEVLRNMKPGGYLVESWVQGGAAQIGCLFGIKKGPSKNKWFRYRLQFRVFSGLVIGWWSKLRAAPPYPTQSWVPPPRYEAHIAGWMNLDVHSSINIQLFEWIWCHCILCWAWLKWHTHVTCYTIQHWPTRSSQ